MKVEELIEKLQKIQDKSIEVAFADFIPVRAVYPCQLGDKVYACVTDNEFFVPEGCLDIDEQMHEQKEFDEKYAEYCTENSIY